MRGLIYYFGFFSLVCNYFDAKKSDGGFFSRNIFARKSRPSVTSGEVSQSDPKSPISETDTSGSPLSSPDDPSRRNSKSRQLPYTKEYEYEERIVDGRKSDVPVGGFKYEKDRHEPIPETYPPYDKSPGLRKSTGLAFNYAPGDEAKVAETVEKRRLAERGGGDMFDRSGSSQSGEMFEIGLPPPPVSPTRSPESFTPTRSPTRTYAGSQTGNITTPEKDKEFDIASFGNENKFVSPIILGQRKPPSPIQFNRAWSGRNSGIGSEPTNIEEMTHQQRMASIFAQPGYTTSFLNSPVSSSSAEGDGLGIQNRNFLSSSPTQHTQPLSTSTPIGNVRASGVSAPFITPIARTGMSESMITHPGTAGSRITSPGDRFEFKEAREGRSRSRSGSSSDSQRLRPDKSSSSSSEDEDSIVRKFLKRENGRYDQILRGVGAPVFASSAGESPLQPKIVKTTVKQTVIKDADGLRHDVHEKVEDLGTGRVLLSSSSNQVRFILKQS